ncbi:MAG: chemotaxis response regulator protein-glutamate methylesterase [Synergistetes bacterium HGW-Synergistetes-2]|jgi:two-component system chemotaxis response regulator CheB|nr:MAG: chemotaxis response regulator protein-glutamate methylesterase [Synergistetes bacterium HGW-Synergistetes-2]
MADVLIVDDSALLRRILKQMLSKDPGLNVIGCVESGEAALQFLENTRVDVVTMDIHMPGMGGFDATRRIMESPHPVPVVIISSCWDPNEVEKTFEAMDAGAVAILPKPADISSGEDGYSAELLKTVNEAAMSKVGRLRQRKRPMKSDDAPRNPLQSSPPHASGRSERRISLVGVGASTGGPQALAEFLARLPADFPCPLLVVQHIAAGFTSGLAEWLGKVTPLPVRVAQNGQKAMNGVVHIAPDGFHMGVRQGGFLSLAKDPPEHMVRPSASVLFRSLAAVYGGAATVILFSGMGKDGAAEMKTLRNMGAVTFAQDRESSVVWGMPGEAVRLDAVEHVGSPATIASLLLDQFR